MQIEDRTQDFSKLVQVSLRDAWTHEAYSFTPWLARPENLEQLGDAINIPLILEDIEQYIGTFKADIVARSTDTEQLVLIENQLVSFLRIQCAILL